MKTRILYSLLCILLLPLVSADDFNISDVKIIEVDANSAVIEWQTNEPATGRINYGPSPDSLHFAARHTLFFENHSMVISGGIQTETTYYFEVVSENQAGEEITEDNKGLKFLFTTLDVTVPPQVQNLQAQAVLSTSVTLSWDEVAIDDFNYYLVYRNGEIVANTTFNLFTDENLNPQTVYTYQVHAADNAENKGELSGELSLRTLQEGADGGSGSDATSGDDTGGGSDTSGSGSGAGGGAGDGTTSEEGSGTQGQGGSGSTAGQETPDLLILDRKVVGINQTSATVTFGTNRPATAEVRYGVGDLSSNVRRVASPLHRAAHELVLENLTAGRKYQYEIKACDFNDICATNLSSFVAGSDKVHDGIEVELPRHINRVNLDIFGTTEPFSDMKVFVNDMNLPARILTKDVIGSTGQFTVRAVLLQADNDIKLVSTDNAGNTKEKTFKVGVDTSPPIIVFEEIPEVTSQRNLTLVGQVNEEVEMTVFSIYEKEIPNKLRNVTGLKVEDVGPNHVTLTWDNVDDSDFSHYIVHRDDASPIAMTHPDTYTTYTDLIVDSDQKYKYQVSYKNRFGYESPKTKKITATTLPGGVVANQKPPRINTNFDFSEAREVFTVSGAFAEDLNLNRGDGLYEVQIEIRDIAGNAVTKTFNVVLDTKPPFIEIINFPQESPQIYENYADNIDIQGLTEPGATVHLFVGRTPLINTEYSIDAAGFPDALEEIPETEFTADCNSVIKGSQRCPYVADETTTADDNGFFTFEGIDLNGFLTALGQVEQQEVLDFDKDEYDEDNSPLSLRERNAKLFFIAIDDAGLRNSLEKTMRVVNCWSGNLNWDVYPEPRWQTPSFISTERLAENNAAIYFVFNYSYFGSGEDPIIRRITLTKACGDKELLDSRFNISCDILPAGDQPSLIDEAQSLSRSAIKLSALPGMDRWLKQDWDNFFESINSELTFPFRVIITYEHDVNGEKVTDTQSTCQEVTYVMDNSKIAMNHTLPDWLLFDFVDFLNESLVTIREIQEHVETIAEFLAPACLASMGVHFATKVWTKWTTFKETLKMKTADWTGFDVGTHSEYCQKLIDSFEASAEYSNKFELDHLSDKDLERCFPALYTAWKTEATTYQAYRFTCDRLFGHKTPSKWTETKSDSELQQHVEVGGTCYNDQSARGQPLLPKRCDDIARSGGIYAAVAKNHPGRTCFEVRSGSGSSLYVLEEKEVAKDIFRIRKLVDGGYDAQEDFVIKVTPDAPKDQATYLTSRRQSCQELCGLGGRTSSQTGYVLNSDGSEGHISGTTTGDKKLSKYAVCTTVQQCIEANANKQMNLGGRQIEGIESAQSVGYTYKVTENGRGACFYEQGKTAAVVGDSPTAREECCCLNTVGQEQVFYYHADDTYLSKEVRDVAQDSRVHEIEETAPAGDVQSLDWSYRYSRSNFQSQGQGGTHTEYNPYRYVRERDLPACFGTNNLFYESFRGAESLLIIDSAKQWTSMLQCANIGGMRERLRALANGLSLLQTCLISVRTTGTDDAGVCKELFNQYVCSFAWDAIQFILSGGGNSCTPLFDDLLSSDEEDSMLATYVKGGVGSVFSAADDFSREVNSEYENAKIAELFGGGSEALARKVCMAAFGSDWEITADGLLDAAYAQPFASYVIPATKSREFLTVDPTNGETKYEYRASWVITPGCPLRNYDVKLACITRDTLESGKGANCEKQVSKDGINCPCLDIEEQQPEKIFYQFSGNRIQQNELQDVDEHRIIDSLYRYDHLKFTLRPDFEIDESIRDECFPTGYEDGVYYFPIVDRTAQDLIGCTVETRTGSINCQEASPFFNERGTSYFQTLRVNGEPASKFEEVPINNPLIIEGEVFNGGGDKCLRMTLNPGGRERVKQIVGEGLVSLPPLQFTDRLVIGNPRSGLTTPAGIEVAREGRQQNNKDVFFNIRIRDQGTSGADDFYDITKDKIFIDGIELPDGANIDTDEFRRVNGNGKETTKIHILENHLVLEKQGAKVRILNVNFAAAFNANVNAQEGIASGVITVPPAQGTGFDDDEIIGDTQRSQNMMLTVGLYHLKGERQAYRGPDDCNFNDIVRHNGDKQELEVPFRIITQSIEEAELATKPGVSNIEMPSQALTKVEPTQRIIARVTDETTIKSKRAVIKETTQSAFTTEKELSESLGEDLYQTTVSWEDFDVAGEYQVTIVAEDNDPVGSQKTERLAPGVLRVACSSQGEGYCRPSCDNEITTRDDSFKRCAGELKCCPT